MTIYSEIKGILKLVKVLKATQDETHKRVIKSFIELKIKYLLGLVKEL